jgi:hypothetical protein
MSLQCTNQQVMFQTNCAMKPRCRPLCVPVIKVSLCGAVEQPDSSAFVMRVCCSSECDVIPTLRLWYAIACCGPCAYAGMRSTQHPERFRFTGRMMNGKRSHTRPASTALTIGIPRPPAHSPENQFTFVLSAKISDGKVATTEWLV